MNTSPPQPNKPPLGEAELTLSGVLHVATGNDLSHLPLTEALQLSLQVVRLVAETHDKGKVVGVLDAAHLICGRSGNLAVGGTGGNPIAPELKRGEMPDRLTDVYALGALVYRLLTGRRVDPTRLIEPPSHFNPAVEPALDELVLCALDEDPSERPYSARDLEQRLLSVYDELGLEDSRTEATNLIAKARPWAAAKLTPLPAAAKVQSIAALTLPAPSHFTDDEDDDGPDADSDAWSPVLERNPLDKKWLVGGGAVLMLFLLAFLVWPSSKKPTPTVSDEPPRAAAKATNVEAPKPAEAPVQARLVPAAPSAPSKAKTESPKKSTRRARR